MARTTAQGQSYPLLAQVVDPTLRIILRTLMDQVNELRQPAGTMDFGGSKLTGLPTPIEATDAANKSYVDSATEPTAIRASLLPGGAAPLDLSALRGQSLQVQKAKLRVNPSGAALPTTGQPFELLYDVDTAAQYYWNATTSEWIIL